jgi:CRISPR-associated endonuclease Csn1
VSFKQNLRVINKTTNKYQRWETKNGQVEKIKALQKGENWSIRKSLHAETVSGRVFLQRIKENKVPVASVLDQPNSIVNKEIKSKLLSKRKECSNDILVLKNYLKDNPIKIDNVTIDKVLVYETIEATATRKALDISFDEKKIEKITDTGIQKILFNHLRREIYQNAVDEKGKKIPPNELAFSEDGLDKLNQEINILNDGKPHKPIIKVRVFEEGNKFRLGNVGNKKGKYVEASKGTNLFFAIYKNEEGKRNYVSIPFNEVMETLKQNASNQLKSSPVPEKHIDEKTKKEHTLLFHLSPNDLVYLPTAEEIENSNLVNFKILTKEQSLRIYKVVSFTNSQCFFVRNDIATPIVNKVEFSTLNKMEKSMGNPAIMVKEFCWKLNIDRLGKIKGVLN